MIEFRREKTCCNGIIETDKGCVSIGIVSVFLNYSLMLLIVNFE